MIFIAGYAAVFLLLYAVVHAVGPLTERLLKRTAHWTASFRYRDYLPVFVILATGLAATAMGGDAFMDIAERLQRESSGMHEVDSSVHAWARETRTTGSTTFFTIMTLIGTPVGMAILVALIAAVLGAKGRWRWAAYLIFTGGVGGLLNLWLKAAFERSRPELAEALRGAHGYSFPSGHAMGSTIVFGALGYLAFRVFKTWRARAIAVAFTTSMIVAIAASRIYLGVHWISDIAAGFAAGFVWLVVATVTFEAFWRIRKIRGGEKEP